METTTTTRHPRKTREQWKTLIQQYDESNLSAAEFCKQHGISYPSLAKWRSILNGQKREHQPGFVELTSSQYADSSTDSAWAVELSIGQHITLRIR